MEYWQSIESGDVQYCVSSMGRIWSSNKGVIKTPLNNCGYPHFNRRINGFSKRTLVHRMAALAFIPNPEGKKTVNHKNGIRSDNRVENLEWATSTEQNQHSVKVLGRRGGPNNHRKKTVVAINDATGERIEQKGIRALARYLGIPYQGIQNALKYPSRTYFNWRFELVHDPMWAPKERKYIPEILLQYVEVEK